MTMWFVSPLSAMTSIGITTRKETRCSTSSLESFLSTSKTKQSSSVLTRCSQFLKWLNTKHALQKELSSFVLSRKKMTSWDLNKMKESKGDERNKDSIIAQSER